MSSEPWSAAALRLGCAIAADAVWHEGECSWMGAALDPKHRARPEYRAVGPLLYDGTAGIALFLAYLAVHSEEPVVRRTALGAARHAVRRCATLASSDGFYAGTLGAAWAVARVGALLDAPKLRAAAAGIPVPGSGPQIDLVSGTSGTVVALLGLAEEFQDAGRLSAAIDRGESLLRARPALCGAAHGAAGIGWALLELSVASGDARFARAAESLFAWERSRFDVRAGHWPDLRRPVRAPVGAMRGTWCYGEVGIGLSRRRAFTVLGAGPHCLDADIATSVVRRHLVDHIRGAFDDFSLCHGLAGAVVALLATNDPSASAALAGEALSRHGVAGDWPCGAYGTTPGLMRGLSGIGWLYLGLADPSVPSPFELPVVVDIARVA